MNINTKYFSLKLTALFVLTVWVGTARADLSETDGGKTYDITFVTGTFDNLAATLEASPIWGDSDLAGDLTIDVGAAAPASGNGYDLAYFAFELDSSTIVHFLADYPGIVATDNSSDSVNNTRTFADVTLAASSVPESASCFTTAFIFVPLLWAGLKQFRQHRSLTLAGLGSLKRSKVFTC